MTDRTCGYEDTTNGHPCKREAGLGTGREIGPCWEHLDLQGRPSTFTDEIAREAIEVASDPVSQSGVARAIGVHEATLRSWLDRSPDFVDEDGAVQDFSRAFMRARAEPERLLTRGPLLQSDEIDGQHARFLLGTAFKYVKTERREVDLDQSVRYEDIPEEDAAAIREALAERRREDP